MTGEPADGGEHVTGPATPPAAQMPGGRHGATAAQPWWRRLGVHVAVIASYLLIAFIHVRPLAFRFTETIPRGERADVLLHGWIISWTARQLLRAPWDLFQANIFFPHPDALTYTEHMVPEALPVVPVWAATGDPILTYNVAFMLTFVLGGWGTFLLVRRLTGNPWAAWLAGVFACYFPAKRWSLAHINTISVHGVPFAMLALHRLVEKPGLGRAVIAGIMVALASLVSAYYTVYLPLLLALAVPLIWWAERYPFDRRRVLAMAAAALVAIAIALPLLMPYLGTWTGGDGPARSYDLQVAGAVDVAEFFILDSVFWSRFLVPEALDPLTTPFFPGAVAALLLVLALFAQHLGASTPNPAAADNTTDSTRRGVRALGYGIGAVFLVVLGRHLVEHHREIAAFRPGPPAPFAVLSVLAVVSLGTLVFAEGRAFPAAARALWRRFMTSPRLVRAYAATTALAMLMALGPRLKFFGYEGPPLPYLWIYNWYPGASALRAPYRAAILGQAFLAVLLGFGAAWLLSRTSSRRWAPAAPALVLAVVMVAETTGTALPLHDIPQPDNGVYAWLAGQPGEFGILEWPIARLMDDTAPGQWLSTYHWKHRVTGHNGRLPEDIRELHPLARQWPPNATFLDTLRDRFPVRYVIVDLGRFERATQRQLTEQILPGIADWWTFERAFGNKRVYRVRNGGDGRNLRRRFAGWMPRGELVVLLAASVPDEDGWRMIVEIGDARLPVADLPPGATEIRVSLPDGLTAHEPVWLRLAIEGPGGQTLAIERIFFEAPDGIIYP